MTMHKALHPRNDVDKLYVSRKGGGRGFAGVYASIQRLEDFIKMQRMNNTSINKTKITRKQKWKEKQL